MLALFVIYLYIGFTTGCVGLLTAKGLEKIRLVDKPAGGYQPDLLMLTGYGVLTGLVGFYSLFAPVGEVAPHLVLAGLCLFTLFRYGSRLTPFIRRCLAARWQLSDLFFGLVAGLYGLLLADHVLSEPNAYDTGLYHAQTIQWIEKYPVVPGLGNLHGRLAFNSSFFLLAALYKFSFLPIPDFYALNGFLSFLLLGRLLVELRRHTRCLDLANVFIAALLLLYLFAKPLFIFSASPHTDLVLVVVLYYLFFLWSDRAAGGQPASDYRLACLVLLGFGLVTAKLSAIPVLLLLVFEWHRGGRRQRDLVLGGALGALLFVPWLVRNVILSGYLVYPVAALDLFGFDWEIPRAYVVAEQQDIRGWAIRPGFRAREAAGLPLRAWVGSWFAAKTGFNRALFLACALSPVLAVGLYLKSYRRYLPFWLVSFAGFAFWFYSAPDFRFGYGYLFFGCIIPLAGLVQWATAAFPRVRRGLVYALLLGVYTWGVLHVSPKKNLPFYRQTLVFPQALRGEVPVVHKPAANFTVTLPARGDQCYNAPLPCAVLFNPQLEMRGTHPGQGFRTKQ